jgi:hypothetical protein
MYVCMYDVYVLKGYAHEGQAHLHAYMYVMYARIHESVV